MGAAGQALLAAAGRSASSYLWETIAATAAARTASAGSAGAVPQTGAVSFVRS